MNGNPDAVAPQFDDALQQRAAAETGMWVFIASEILFFGALFFAYAVTRMHFPEAFAAAGRRTDVVIGSINTAVLLTSSYTMALALHAARLGRTRAASRLLALTLLLATIFLGFKAVEYYHDYRQHLVPALNFDFAPAQHDGAEFFFYLYFVMTGFHAVHLVAGMCAITVIAAGFRRPHTRRSATQVALLALYWHLVDVIWIFLYPLFYLVARS